MIDRSRDSGRRGVLAERHLVCLAQARLVFVFCFLAQTIESCGEGGLGGGVILRDGAIIPTLYFST